MIWPWWASKPLLGHDGGCAVIARDWRQQCGAAEIPLFDLACAISSREAFYRANEIADGTSKRQRMTRRGPALVILAEVLAFRKLEIASGLSPITGPSDG